VNEVRIAGPTETDEVRREFELPARSAGRPDQADVVLVAFEDGRAIGAALVRRGHFFGRDFLEHLVVVVDARRRGHGRRLLEAFATVARTRAFTSTNESNGPMRRMLESAGFTPCGEVRGLDDDDPELFYFRSGGSGAPV
jgi:GNAT superfamily N-acetyltransferase